MKICNKCNRDEKTTIFGTNKAKKDGLQNQCKECRRERQKLWYNNNKEVQAVRVKTGKEISRNNARVFVFNYLKENSCIDCDEKDIIVLEFDHREPKEKFLGIAQMIQNRYSVEAIKKEIEKCDVVCANCHRRRTAKQFDWFKLNYGSAQVSENLS